MGSQEFKTYGNSPAAFRDRTIVSVRPISIMDAREIAIGVANRNKSKISDGRAQAGQTRLGMVIPFMQWPSGPVIHCLQLPAAFPRSGRQVQGLVPRLIADRNVCGNGMTGLQL